MRIILLAATLSMAATTVAEPIRPAKCGDENARSAAPRSAKPQNLGDMPAATQFKAVRNLIDGCPRPVVVRQDVGRAPLRR